MGVIAGHLVFGGLFIVNMVMLTDSYGSNSSNVIRHNYESTYQLITNANTEQEVIKATKDFRATGPNDAYFMEPNNIFSDLALFLCAMKLTRMCIDEVYATEIRSNATPSTPPSNDLNALAREWSNYFKENNTSDGFGGRVREAFRYQREFDDEYATQFVQSVVRTADLCRRYEGKIREIEATFDRHVAQHGMANKIGLWHVLKNYDDWNFTFDDVQAVKRVRFAQKLKPITWNWMDMDNKTIIPFCVECLGSLLRGSSLPEKKKNAFLYAFSKLPQRVLWKWDRDILPGKSENIMIMKWMPQRDILDKLK